MKIGLLTRRYGYNFGSTLQGFALMTLLENLGHEVEVLDYDETTNHWRWKIRPIIDKIKYHLKWLFPSEEEYLNQRFSQEAKFKEFERSNFHLSNGRLTNEKKIGNCARSYDRIVIGSDQIWNPFFFDPVYFGSFLKSEEKNLIVPYAPSIGITRTSLLPQREIELLTELPVLSCREKAGGELLKRLTGKDVSVVLDPTLMLDREFWSGFAEKYEVQDLPERYILTYFLGQSVDSCIIEQLQVQLGLPIVNVSVFNRPNNITADIHVRDAGPGEFLFMLKNAAHVITDSFHGTIFSTTFERPLTVLERFKQSDIRNENSRIYTLLETLGKQDCLWGNNGTGTEGHLEEKRVESLTYLRTHLS